MPMDKNFDAASAEPRLYAAWEAAGAFKAGKHVTNDESRAFTVMIPPPNVTGALHVGHAFNNTLQDILARWHRMRGFDVLWQPGQDHAGIATQLQVEKMLAATQQPTRAEMGREEFLKKVWEWKAEYGSTIIGQLKRLGASCDWSRNAFTMAGAPGDPRIGHENSADFHDAVIKVFVDLHAKGLIFRGKRLVNWDPHFETAISDVEVENIEVSGHMWHFKYPLAGGQTYDYIERDEDGAELLRETRDYISIATTRPETMLGDGAVAVHPSDSRYAPLIGKLCEIPVGPKEQRRLIPIITDEYPDPSFGSGAVKITGAHDFNDYAVALRGGIPLYRLMDTRAQMRGDGAPYAEAAAIALAVARGERGLTGAEVDAINLVPDDLRGLDRFEARKRVVAQITEEGLAVMVPGPPDEDGAEGAPVPLVEAKKIMQPFGDRSKVVIEPMLTDQWFVDAEKLANAPIESVRAGRVTILPESGEKTFYHWMENIEPWCISRQLWWGHQIPVWYGLDLSAPDFVDDEGNGDLDQVELGRLLNEGGMVQRGDLARCGVDFADVVSQFQDANADTPAPISLARVIEATNKQEAIRLFAEGLAEYNVSQDLTKLVFPVWRDPDVLDTWFSSGLWPFGTLGWPDNTPELKRHFPGDVLITGQDILFFWVARMMMMSQAVTGKDPFHTVYLHQLVRDVQGKKMSKTTGNVIDPLEMIDEFGADALRFTNASMAAIGGVLKLSLDRIKGYRNFGTKLWNACRFAEMNAVFTAPRGRPQPKETVNRWIIGEVGRVREEVDAAIEGWRFNDAAGALYGFVWGKVCDWYVEFSKPLLLDGSDEVKAETRATMRFVLEESLKLLHPMMPFITEELWAEMGNEGLLMLTEWPTHGAELIDPAADEEMTLAIALIEGIRSARAQMNVPAGLQVPLLELEADSAAKAAWARNEALIRKLARVDSLSVATEAPKGALTVAIKGAAYAIPLADIIDVTAEKARLGKALEKLGKEIGGLNGRLGNPNFATSAPEEVVEEARANLAARQEEQAQLQAALARLSEIG